MKQSEFIILSNRRLTESVFLMELEGDTSAIVAAGSFVEIALPEQFLRRPISVCNVEGNRLTLIYKVVGKGTALMAELQLGTRLNLLTGLGNGFRILENRRPLLVGGGVGVPPLYWLARTWLNHGVKPLVVLGFNNAAEIFFKDEFESLGLKVVVATADGSYGVKGFVTDAIDTLDDVFDFYQACGPMPMLKALNGKLEMEGDLSLEERMGCGFGACMGCSIHTLDGPKRVCCDGPVFNSKILDLNNL